LPSDKQLAILNLAVSVHFFVSRVFLFSLVLGLARADDTPVSPVPKGVIILNATAGNDAAAVAFASIEWTNPFGGTVVDGVGAKTGFTNEAIGKIIYFDQVFYDQLDKNPAWIDWRAGLQSREFVVRQNAPGVLTRGDLQTLQTDEAAMEDLSQRYPLAAPLLAPQETLLKDEIGKLAGGQVWQNGKWLTQQEADATSAVPVVGDAANTVTFTSKDGRKFANAKATVTDTGLSVLTSDGGASVAFNQLPDDLSVFPKKLQDQIAAGKHALAAASTPAPEIAPAPDASGTGQGGTSAAASGESNPTGGSQGQLINGDFSQVDANGLPVGWKLEDANGNETSTTAPGEAYKVIQEGGRTFLHVSKQVAQQGTKLVQTVDVPAGATYCRLKFDLRSSYLSSILGGILNSLNTCDSMTWESLQGFMLVDTRKHRANEVMDINGPMLTWQTVNWSLDFKNAPAYPLQKQVTIGFGCGGKVSGNGFIDFAKVTLTFGPSYKIKQAASSDHPVPPGPPSATVGGNEVYDYSTYARLGESEDAILRRNAAAHIILLKGYFGFVVPLDQISFSRPTGKGYFDHGGDALFFRGVACEISVGGALTVEQVERILAANSQGHTWTHTGPDLLPLSGTYAAVLNAPGSHIVWMRDDGAKANLTDQSIVIITKQLLANKRQP
jgi:hypothetical protein